MKQINEISIKISKEKGDKLTYPIMKNLDENWQNDNRDIRIVFTAGVFKRDEKDNNDGTLNVDYIVKLKDIELVEEI